MPNRSHPKVRRVSTATTAAKARVETTLTKAGTFRPTAKVLLLTRQSSEFYSNRVMAADLGQSDFLSAGTLIMLFEMKFKFSKNFKQLVILHKVSVFLNWIVMLFQ